MASQKPNEVGLLERRGEWGTWGPTRSLERFSPRHGWRGENSNLARPSFELWLSALAALGPSVSSVVKIFLNEFTTELTEEHRGRDHFRSSQTGSPPSDYNH